MTDAEIGKAFREFAKALREPDPTISRATQDGFVQGGKGATQAIYKFLTDEGFHDAARAVYERYEIQFR